MRVSVIKTRGDYEAALSEVEELASNGVEPGSPEHDRLEVLAVLISDYEDRNEAIALPDPIEAIRFRMEQQGLQQRDLVPFIGSRSRVSEVLSGKRPLTLTMIRSLHKGLGIPAGVLLQAQSDEPPEVGQIEWTRFPILEMARRGWIEAPGRDWRSRAEEIMRAFRGHVDVDCVGGFYKRTRTARDMDPYALDAWCARVVWRAMEQRLPREFRRDELSMDLLYELGKLSARDDGPALAKEFLERQGIHVVIEPHLAKTHLDGAALLTPDGEPVVGLTIRHDRLDNFWFCLLHEVVHVWRHLSDAATRFIDDLDSEAMSDPQEEEADRVAREALVPTKALRGSRAAQTRTPGAVQALAVKLGVSASVVAGRVRYDARNFRILNQLIGQGEVRRLFPEFSDA